MRAFSILYLLSLFFSVSNVIAAVESEPNNDSASANPLNALTPVTGTQLDEDWYVITVPPGAEHVIIDLTFVHADGNIDMDLYDDPPGLFLSRQVSTTDNEFIDDNDNLTAGTHYIRVYGGPGGDLGNAYTLTWASFAPDSDDGFEDNDDSANTTAAAENALLFGVLLDPDWYSIDVQPGSQRIEILLKHKTAATSSDGADIDFELRDTDGNLIASSATMPDTENESVVATNLAAGTYNISVFEAVNTLPNGYSLTWDDTTAIPAVPANIIATAGNTEVALSWDAAPTAASYTVYWNTTGGVTTGDSSISAGSSTMITHSSLANGTTYYYRVLATNAGGSSDLSVETSATPLAPPAPAVPANVMATAGNAEVMVSWDAAPTASSYTVYWNTTGGVTTGDSSISAGSNTMITHSSLTNGTTYYYRVLATNAGGSSDLSAQASATPVAPAGSSSSGAFSPLSIFALLLLNMFFRRSRKNNW